jgi:translocation and assembly module TamB
VKKRQAALLVLLLVTSLVAATLVGLRTSWAGDRICALAALRLAAATGLPVSVRSCRLDPLSLAVTVEGLRLGPPERPLLEVAQASARLAPVQGLGRRVELAELRLSRPRLWLAPRAGLAGSCPPPLMDRVDVRRLQVVDGALELELPSGLRASVDGLAIDAEPAPGARWRLGRAPRRSLVAVGAERLEISAAGRRWALGAVALQGKLAHDLSGLEEAAASATAGRARLEARGAVRQLCRPDLDLEVAYHGSLPELVGLLGGRSPGAWQAELAAEATVRGRPAAPEVAGTVRFEGLSAGPVKPGSGSAAWRWLGDRIAVDRLELPVGGGAVRGRGEVQLRRGAPFDADFTLDDVELGELLERLAVPRAWVTARLDGAGHLAGPAWPTALTGSLEATVRRFRSLAGPWRERRDDPFAFVEFDEGRLSGPFAIEPVGLRFDQARLEVGTGSAEVTARIGFRPELGFEVRATGEAELDALRHLARLPWSGRAALTARIHAAPYGNPRAEARVRVERFHFLQLDLGNATAAVSYGPDWTLRVDEVDGVKGESRYRGFAHLDLHQTPIPVTESRFTASGRLRDFFDGVMDWLPSTRLVRDVLDGEVAEVTVTAWGPAAALDASFEGRLGAGSLAGRRFESGRAVGRVEAGAAVVFDRLELQHGPGAASARGRWGFLAPYPWELELSLRGMPASALALPGGAWTGSVSGTASLRGSWEEPDVRIAVNGDAVTVSQAALGTVQLGGTVQGHQLLLTGGADGVRVSMEAGLRERLPFRAEATLTLEDAARFWPGGPPAGLRAAVEGTVSAEGELLDLAGARGRLKLPRLAAGYADLKLENAGPVELAWDRGRVEVGAFTLRGANTEFSLTGVAALHGALDLVAAGALDLRLLSGVLPAARRPHGTLRLEAHVGGTAARPVLLGGGRLEEGGFQLRGAGVALERLTGDLAFSQNRILFDALEGEVNGGRVGLSGEVELEGLAPVRHRVEATLDEVPMAVPATLPVVLSGRLEGVGTPDDTLVTGRLHVVRARYTEDVDLEKSLLELRRRRVTASRPYDKAGEWLHLDVQVAVDGDARVENDLVRGDVKGELTVTGTLASPGLVGSLSMERGSRATFRGNDFELSHALVEFTDRSGVALALDVHGEARVSDYQVFMHLFGSLSDPQLTLTSIPPLSQPDVITLLSVGFTRRDAAVGTGVQGVATAAAAQALFAASGLDEQVRRFLPRGGPLKDLSVRITSVYSETSGQVEPRAEFESWVVRDRLRLRFQAPLGSARGRRAQAELRLGTRTTLQYQWDSDTLDFASGDHGLDLKLRWEWTE